MIVISRDFVLVYLGFIYLGHWLPTLRHCEVESNLVSVDAFRVF